MFSFVPFDIAVSVKRDSDDAEIIFEISEKGRNQKAVILASIETETEDFGDGDEDRYDEDIRITAITITILSPDDTGYVGDYIRVSRYLSKLTHDQRREVNTAIENAFLETYSDFELSYLEVETTLFFDFDIYE